MTIHNSCIPRSRVPDSRVKIPAATVAQWQRRLDAAIAPLVALRDGIGQPDITGQQLYALETAVFNALGELVETMESTPFDDLVNALGLKSDYLAAAGILDQYQAEKAAYEAQGGSDDV